MERRRAPARRRNGDAAFEVELAPLGSGADFVAFQDHLGLPTLPIEFDLRQRLRYGTYHSNYDTRPYIERVGDPGFTQGVLMSRVLGTIALRMAQAECSRSGSPTTPSSSTTRSRGRRVGPGGGDADRRGGAAGEGDGVGTPP